MRCEDAGVAAGIVGLLSSVITAISVNSVKLTPIRRPRCVVTSHGHSCGCRS